MDAKENQHMQEWAQEHVAKAPKTIRDVTLLMVGGGIALALGAILLLPFPYIGAPIAAFGLAMFAFGVKKGIEYSYAPGWEAVNSMRRSGKTVTEENLTSTLAASLEPSLTMQNEAGTDWVTRAQSSAAVAQNSR